MAGVNGVRRRRASPEVRELLIAEASRQFTERGYASTTMKELSEATGVSISVLYHHFPSKADLLREAVLTPFVSLVDSVGASWQALQETPSAEAHLIRQFVSELHEGLHEHRGALLALVTATSELDDAMRAEVSRALRRMFLELRAITEESQAYGWSPPRRVETQLRLLVTLVAGVAVLGDLFLPDRANDSPDQLFDDMTEFVRYGFTGRARAAVNPARG